MSASFVQSAPEIAEEILLKIAGLPKDLASFSRALLTKEASVETEKLELPKRMSLADLQKAAHANHVDLPKVASVDTESWGAIASDLVKIAKRCEAEDAREVFETGAAMAAKTKEAGVVAAIGAAPRAKAVKSPGTMTRLKAFMGSTNAKQVVEKHDTLHEVAMGKIRSHLPKDPAVAIEERKVDAARASSESRHNLAEKMVATAPAIGLAAGTPLAAAAMMSNKNDRKKEEVKIYK